MTGGQVYVHAHPTKRPERILELWYNEGPIVKPEDRDAVCRKHQQADEYFIKSTLIASSGFVEATTGLYCIFTRDTPVKIMAGVEGWYQVQYMDHCHWKIGYPTENGTTEYVRIAPRFIRRENEWCLLRPLYLSPMLRVFIYSEKRMTFHGMGPDDSRFLINPPGEETLIIACANDLLDLRQHILFDTKDKEDRIPVPQEGYPLVQVGMTANWVIKYDPGSLNQTHVPEIRVVYVNYTLFRSAGATNSYLDDRNPWYAVAIQWVVGTLFGSIGKFISQLAASNRFWWSLIVFGITRNLWKSDILAGVLATIVMVL